MSPRIHQWIGLIAVTGAAQVAVQAIGFVSGILVIRLLPVHEYALYTLANTMLGTMVLLADAGISNGVMSQGGMVWKDKQRLGVVISTGMAMRKKYAVIGIFVAGPILLFLLLRHGASWLMCSLIVLSLVPVFYTTLSSKLLEIPAKLHQDIRRLQGIQVQTNVIRLIFLGLTTFAFPFAAVAIACGAIGQAWGNLRLRRLATSYAPLGTAQDPEIAGHISAVVRKSLPNRIYFCFSSQVTVWIISTLGTTSAVAEIGALGRLGQIFLLFSSVITILAIPRFARLPGDRKLLGSKAFQLTLSVACALATMIGLIAAAPGLVLKVLGTSYGSMERELMILLGSSAIGVLAGTIISMSLSRGWVIPTRVIIPFNLIVLSGASLFFNISVLEGVLWLGFTVAVSEVISATLFLVHKIRCMPS